MKYTRAHHITTALQAETVNCPDQWANILGKYPQFLETGIRTAAAPAVPLEQIKKLNFLIRSIHRAPYQTDMDRTGLRDSWEPRPDGDCEDKALYFMLRAMELYGDLAPALHLGVCRLQNGRCHAVAILRTSETDLVADPTLSDFFVSWHTYPVASWIMISGHRYHFTKLSIRPEETTDVI